MRNSRDQLVFISRHALVGGCAFKRTLLLSTDNVSGDPIATTKKGERREREKVPADTYTRSYLRRCNV
jgi:hypothetical protein